MVFYPVHGIIRRPIPKHTTIYLRAVSKFSSFFLIFHFPGHPSHPFPFGHIQPQSQAVT